MKSILPYLLSQSSSWKASDIVTARTVNDQICIEREVCDVQIDAVTVWGTVEVYRGPALSAEELAGLMASKEGAQRYM